MNTLLQDIRFAMRMLRKSPAFAAVAVLTLALGVGANTAIFSFVDAWVLKPIAYPQPDRLIDFSAHNMKKGWTRDSVTSTADFLDFQKQTTSFSQTAAWASWNFNLTGDGPPTVVDGGRVSWNFFDALEVKPLMGRTFTPSDDQAGAAHVAILSEGLWKSRYGGDPKMIGRTITISDEPYTVVGVLSGKFQFPLLGISNLWTPQALTPTERADRNSSWFDAFGRLKPGVSEQQAAAETTAIYARLAKLYPKTDTDQTTILIPMTKDIAENEGVPAVMILFWVVGLILLIACANVANLMLARASQRTKEIAVRGALGATKIRLIRQLLTESLLLFSLGGIGGVLIGEWGMAWIESMIPGRIRGYLVNFGQVNLDFTTLAFTLGIALAAGLIFGMAPAFQSSSVDLNRTLKEASGQASGGRRGARVRKIFVAAEIALAVVVLISTTLLVKSFIISVTASTGYNPQNLMVAQVSLPSSKYASEARQRNFADDVLRRIGALPGVASAGAASAVPFGDFGQIYEVEAVGKPAPQPGETLGARWTAVSPDYFSAMRMRLLKGRVFTTADAAGNAKVAIIGQTFADQFWPHEDPVGQQLTFGPTHIVCTIVGVINDIKMYGLRNRPERQMYVPLAQFPSSTLGFVARAGGDEQSLPNEIRGAIWAVDADQPISSIEQLQTMMNVQDTGNRVMTKLMIYFGVLALFLCAIGIYGVMAHTVTQRTHEIGIRMALGARPREVLAMIMRQALRLALAGIALGIAAAFVATRSLAFLLYQVKAYDPATFAGVAGLFVILAILACYIPGRRAMRTDPMVALRYE